MRASAKSRSPRSRPRERVFKVATVQNRYNFADRAARTCSTYCEKHGIGFIPWFPLAAGDLSKPGGALDAIAHAHRRDARADRARLAA